MTDDYGNPIECKECADVPSTPTVEGYGWNPIKMGLCDDLHPPVTGAGLDFKAPKKIVGEISIHDAIADELEAAGMPDVLRKHKKLPYASGVLSEADMLINNGRKEDYGHPVDNFRRICSMWEEILGVPVTPAQHAWCMCAVKMARAIESPEKREHFVDATGYVALAYEVQK